MSKFFVNENQINGNIINIIGDDVNHLKNVLRVEIGENINICSIDTAKNYICEVINIDKKSVDCKILEEKESEAESNIQIDVYQGLPKADKMELIIQKGTELGVCGFIPVSFKRSIVKLDEKDEIKKQVRWQKIAEVAAKQSGRDIVPKVEHLKKVKDICSEFKNYDVVLVAYENENKTYLKDCLSKLENKNLKIAIVIGPEGGIDESEIDCFKEAGAQIISLGKRILRTETVALVMTAIINYELECTEEK